MATSVDVQKHKVGPSLFVFGTFTEAEAHDLQFSSSPSIFHHRSLSNNSSADKESAEKKQRSPSLTLKNQLGTHSSAKEQSVSKRELKGEPLGLVNIGNTCFANVILQSVIHCSAMNQLLLQTSASQMKENQDRLFTLGELTWNLRSENVENSFSAKAKAQRPDAVFLANKEFFDGNGINGKPRLELDQAINLSSNKSVRVVGPQQDAQEFLGFLIDALHSEQIQSLKQEAKAHSNDLAASTEDEWQEAGRGKKNAVKVRAVGETKDRTETCISKIFRGEVRSSVSLSSNFKKQSVTLQPFTSLQLDIQNRNIASIQDALEVYFGAEYIDDANSARRSVAIDSMPQVLVLHLKRFAYSRSTQTMSKIKKVIEYPMGLKLKEYFLTSRYKKQLEIETEILGDKTVGGDKSSEVRNFSLFSVVAHHGDYVARGHYTNYTYDSVTKKWFHFDDDVVTAASEGDVLRNPNAYILLYERKRL